MPRTSRRAVVATAVLLLIPSFAAAQGGEERQAPRSIFEGVYTEAQAEQGQAAYRSHCAACHASGFFRGEPFRLVWSGQPASGFFEVMRTSMPIDNPASLEAEEYAAILAYILELNGYPAGEVELPSTREELDLILIEDPEDPKTAGGD